jgi:hypothetical protein
MSSSSGGGVAGEAVLRCPNPDCGSTDLEYAEAEGSTVCTKCFGTWGASVGGWEPGAADRQKLGPSLERRMHQVLRYGT